MNGAVFHSLLSLVSFEEIGGDKQWTRRGGQGSFIVSWPSLFLSRLSISEIWSILELKERFLKTDPFSLRTCTCINTPNKTNNKLKMAARKSWKPQRRLNHGVDDATQSLKEGRNTLASLFLPHSNLSPVPPLAEPMWEQADKGVCDM